MDNMRGTLFSLTILLILATLVIPVTADETLTDTTVNIEPGRETFWYVDHTLEQDDKIGITVELISGTGVYFFIYRVTAQGSLGSQQLFTEPITGTFSYTWTVGGAGTYRFYVVNRDTNNWQQVHLTLVKKTGACLGTLIIAVIPIIAMVCILGKRALS